MTDTERTSPGGDPRDGALLWRTLAAAGPQAIAEALSAADFDRLHVAGRIDQFLADQVASGQSLVLTGNAGDGKTHLLRRIRPALEAAGAVIVEDATALMRHDDSAPVLDLWRQAEAAGRPFCIAANEYPLYQIRNAGVGFGPVDEVTRQCRQRLAYGVAAAEEAAVGVLVVDLSLRNPLAPDLADVMLNALLTDPALQAVVAGGSEPVARRNVELLSQARVRERLRALLDRLIALGDRSTVRELWIILARMVFGRLGRGDFQRADWYSEALFDRDERFDLTLATAKVDPAQSSHPHWDGALESRALPVRSGWALRPPTMPPHPTLDWSDFAALKRRFYFEHASGDEAIALADPDVLEFEALLSGRRAGSRTLVAELVDALNAAYCPVRFDARDQHLYLWNGHRFHEQPSRSFVAVDRIVTDDLTLEIPRLPSRLHSCFDYRADHVALVARGIPGAPRLKIDFPLFQTLKRLSRGLPRKLVPERDVHRVDSFLERLGAGSTGRRDVLWSVHLESLELIQVNYGEQGRRFESVRIYA
jgi:hypothetical protein